MSCKECANSILFAAKEHWVTTNDHKMDFEYSVGDYGDNNISERKSAIFEKWELFVQPKQSVLKPSTENQLNPKFLLEHT